MFKELYFTLIGLIMLSGVGPIAAQTIVSTQPTNKNAVLEEFGGMYCVYCPHGHQIIADLEEGLGENLVAINYQTGTYAEPLGNDPDLGNDYSALLEDEAYITGYPAGTINRHSFPGLEQNGLEGITAIGRSEWGEAITEILQESAPVNIGAEATLNITTRELEVRIEYYYTAAANNPTNRLHLAVLQNNVIAPQHGGDAGSYYNHQHVFREFITGAEGHIITNNEASTFGSLTYNIVLPEFYRDVWMDPVNIELAVFITEDENEVLNGIEVHPTLQAEAAPDVNLLAVMAPEDICDTELAAQVIIRNDSANELENCQIRYGINGGASNEITWTGALPSLETTIIDLEPIATLVGFSSNDFFVEISDPNETDDPTEYNNAQVHNFTIAPEVSTYLLELVIRTDQYGQELYWEVVDLEDNIYASGGNIVVGETNGGAQIASENDPGAYEDNTIIIESIELPYDGCYQLRVLDDYSDGLCCNYGNGFFRLREPGQTPILEGGEFGAIDEKYFRVGDGIVAAEDIVDTNAPLLVPNPISNEQSLSIHWTGTIPANYDWQVFASNGQMLQMGNQQEEVELKQLAAGYYFVQIRYAEERRILPLVVQP